MYKTALTGLVLVLGLSCTQPRASGFSIYEQGAKASAQAGAFAARADDPSALFYNPAGITGLPGWQVQIGTSAIFLGQTSFQNADPASPFLGQHDDMTRNVVWPSHLYVTHHASDRVAWGIGLYMPFGLETEWGDDTSVRFSSRHTSLATAYLNPSVAFQVTKSLSLAVGASLVYGNVRAFARDLTLAPLELLAPGIFSPSLLTQEWFTNLRGNDTDYALNAALQWRGENGLRFGLTYRGAAELDIRDGTVEYQGVPGVTIVTEGVPLSTKFVDGSGTAQVPLPASLALGLGWTGDAWEVEFDMVWTDWSAFDSLDLTFENTSTINLSGTPAGPFVPIVADQSIPENWSDTHSWRIGAGYRFRDRNSIRFGAYLDENPIPMNTVRPSLPDANRRSLQAGYGFETRAKRFQIDTYLQWIQFNDRIVSSRATLPNGLPDASVILGTYQTRILLAGFSAAWRF